MHVCMCDFFYDTSALVKTEENVLSGEHLNAVVVVAAFGLYSARKAVARLFVQYIIPSLLGLFLHAVKTR